MDRNCDGYTLVEVLTVLAVAGVMASVAVPGMQGLASSARVSGAANGMLADLFLARSEAIKRRLRVVVCRSADGASCAPAGSWEQGWIVFADVDGNGQRAPGEALVRVQQALPAGVRLTGTATLAKYVSYAPTGAAKTIGGGFQAGTLTVCATSLDAAPARRIVISSSGRPRTQKVQLPSCG
jgi:type IV fimbrial biogenesis protein FimT